VVENVERFHSIRAKQYPASNIITRVSGVKYSQDQDLDSMEKFWGGLVDQVAFVAYNPWENTYQRPTNHITAPCSDLWRRMFVWWDGKVNPCDVDYKSTLSVGNGKDQGLSELWTSEAYGALRAAHLNKNRRGVSPCSSCTVV
jgi:radical SAM protein with 4Fe4S-binding SPASM domain